MEIIGVILDYTSIKRSWQLIWTSLNCCQKLKIITEGEMRGCRFLQIFVSDDFLSLRFSFL